MAPTFTDRLDCSALPVFRPGGNWNDLLSAKHRTVHCQHRIDIPTFLLSSGDLQGIVHAPHRATLCASGSCLIWDYTYKHIPVWTQSLWTLAEPGCNRAVLDRLWPSNSRLYDNLHIDVRLLTPGDRV